MHRFYIGASPALDGGASSGAALHPDACPEEGGGFVTRDYELGFILTPEVNEEQTRAILERIEQIVNNYGGQIVRVNQWGRRRLAYPIQHNRDGFYVFIDMILTPETVRELDRTLKVSEEVIRHLIKRRDPITVQKEREAYANAPTQAAPPSEGEMPDEEEASVAEEQEAPASTEEGETSVVLTAEEDGFVPPAIDEEAEEAVEA
ncbi:MAG TPA: 30S ribosomal protein S6 [Ktedonobacteraceae bacterium]|nr:30S ribosomal protein S6 [Ktedonobacteraceae bacterium]